MLILVGFVFAIVVVGLSAVTLAEREKLPCTACRKAAVVMSRDFVYRCPACKAGFRRVAGVLERVDAGGPSRP